MKSEQIKYFLETAKYGSMLQVAQNNFMSQPAVSLSLIHISEPTRPY